MPPKRMGTHAIDETLRLARDAIERDVARYRVLVFAAVTAVTAGLRFAGLTTVWTPAVFFACATAYAVALRAFIVRRGNPPGLAPVLMCFDLVLCAAPFHIVFSGMGSAERVIESAYPAYILGPGLMLALFINSLRNAARASLVGGAIAVVLYEATIAHVAGFHPAQIPIGVMMVLAGVIGAAAARQARKNLDDFARLELLRRYLPPEAVERVMREDPDEAIAPGGRLATVTLLAADLRGFTSMSENLAPRDVMAQLNAYHGVMIDVIERHGGAIDKFIGDGTLVVFGLRGDEREAAASAVACAKAMVDALAAHNEERARVGAAPLAMGVGVHTGPVIAGNLGVPGRRLEFTVIGDAVNTVSRLEGQTKTAGCAVIVSAATVERLGDAGGLRELSPVSLRGRQSTLRVYGLVAPQGGVSAFSRV
jgi:adenylate cyclase